MTRTPASDFLRSLAARVPAPKAILVVSAHWEAARPTVGLGVETIHDFYGFPQPLYDLQYPAPVARDVAARAAELLKSANVAIDPTRGRDHGVWSPLILAWPDAQVPVVPLSLVGGASPQTHYDIGRALAPLRDEGVLIVGSGNVVHNLMLMRREDGAPAFGWAKRFNEMVRTALASGRHQPLIEYERMGEDARLSVPTPEHYLPLLYIAALQAEGETMTIAVDGYEAGSLGMLSAAAGMPANWLPDRAS
jgi:4,5-DOPA dioxygenase extradiol